MARIPAREWHAANNRRYGKPAGDTRLAADAPVAAALGLDYSVLPDAWYAFLPFVSVDTDDGPVIAATDEPELPFTASESHPFWYQLPDGRVVDEQELIELVAKVGRDTPPPVGYVIGENVSFAPPHLIPHDPTTGPSDTATVLTLAPDGRAGILRDRHANLLYVPRRDHDQHLKLYTDGRQFFRAWIAARIRHRQEVRAAHRDYMIERPERIDGCVPGALLIGDARRVAWPLDRNFVCADDETARAVNAGIIRSARLSRATVATPAVRKAA